MLFPRHSTVLQRQEILRDFKEKKISEAEAGERLRDLEPEASVGYLALGAARAEEAQLDEASALFREALERAPCSPTPYFQLADVLKRAGDRSSGEVLSLAMWKLAMA